MSYTDSTTDSSAYDDYDSGFDWESAAFGVGTVLLGALLVGAAYATGVGEVATVAAGAAALFQEALDLIAGRTSCDYIKLPPPPPPINWHKIKPKTCNSGVCHTPAPVGDLNGLEDGPTHNAHAGTPNGGVGSACDPSSLADLVSSFGSKPFTGQNTRQDCMSGQAGGSPITYDPSELVAGRDDGMTRPVGAQACYTDPSQLLGGSAASLSVKPPGFQKLRDLGVNVSGCHIIGDKL